MLILLSLPARRVFFLVLASIIRLEVTSEITMKTVSLEQEINP